MNELMKVVGWVHTKVILGIAYTNQKDYNFFYEVLHIYFQTPALNQVISKTDTFLQLSLLGYILQSFKPDIIYHFIHSFITLVYHFYMSPCRQLLDTKCLLDSQNPNPFLSSCYTFVSIEFHSCGFCATVWAEPR